jgi:hypothetical protein
MPDNAPTQLGKPNRRRHRERGRWDTRRRAIATGWARSRQRRALTMIVAAGGVGLLVFGIHQLTSGTARPDAAGRKDLNFDGAVNDLRTHAPIRTATATATALPVPSSTVRSPSRSVPASARPTRANTGKGGAVVSGNRVKATGTRAGNGGKNDAGARPASKPVVTTPRPVSGTGAVLGVSGLCLDVTDARTDAGAPLQIFTCNGTGAQTWTVRANGTITAFGMCLSVADGIGRIITCSGSATQNWTMTADGAIRNSSSGQCLATASGAETAFTRVVTANCNGAATQRWMLN